MDESKAKELINDGWNEIKNNDAKKLQLANLYLSIHRQQPCCLDVLENFFKDLPNILLIPKSNLMKSNSEKKFLLKAGSVVYVPSAHVHHTPESMSDEQAIEMLQENPNRIKLFEKYPGNWQSMKSGKKEKKKSAEPVEPAIAETPSIAEASSTAPASESTTEPSIAPSEPAVPPVIKEKKQKSTKKKSEKK